MASRRDVLLRTLGAIGAASTGGIGALAQTAAPLTRAIPHSGERLPAVGLGTAINFDVAEDDKRPALQAVVDELIAGGGRLIDTASAYGQAERVVGTLLTGGRREKVFLATKARGVDGPSANPEFARSLQLLQTQAVDLLQLHNVRDPNQSLAMLREIKARGLCRYIGITTSFERDYGAAEAVLAREKPDFFQVNYSPKDREAEKRLLPAAAEAGAAVLTALPFGRNSMFRAVAGKSVPEWGQEFGARTWAQFFLKFLLSHPAVTAVIPGTNKAEHMRDNLGAARGRLPDAAERARMTALFDSL